MLFAFEMGIYGTTVTEWIAARECKSWSQQVLWEMGQSLLKKFYFASPEINYLLLSPHKTSEYCQGDFRNKLRQKTEVFAW